MGGVARKLAVVLASAVVAVALSGCVAISAISTSQPESMGPVQLTISACSHGAPGCSATSNRGNIYELVETGETVDAQMLVGVRLPEGSTPPGILTASLEKGG